jgi:PEP-CTERM motif
MALSVGLSQSDSSSFLIFGRRAALAVAMVTVAARGARAIDVVGTLPAALDQPQVNVSLSRTANGAALSGEGVDPILGTPLPASISFQAFLDTGASGILIDKGIADLLGPPTDPSISNLKVGSTNVIYTDVGVGGSQDFLVSEPLYVRLAPTNPTVDPENPAAYTQQVGPVNLQITTAAAADPFNIVGVPGMVGKVAVINSAPLNGVIKNVHNFTDYANAVFTQPDDLALQTSVRAAADAPIAGLHVKLSAGSFNQFTTVTPGGAQGPTLAANPFIGPNPVAQFNGTGGSDSTPKVKVSFQGASAEGSFLLDTGAAASMISQNLAAQLHVRYRANTLDVNGVTPILETDSGVALPDQFTVTFGGVGSGNPVTRAGFYLDSLLLRTLEGSSIFDSDPNNLNFLDAPVLVNDISLLDPSIVDPQKNTLTLDGVFAMNFMTSSALVDSSGLPVAFSPGAFDFVTYDQAAGTLGFGINAVPEPATIVLVGIGCFAIAALGYRRRVK